MIDDPGIAGGSTIGVPFGDDMVKLIAESVVRLHGRQNDVSLILANHAEHRDHPLLDRVVSRCGAFGEPREVTWLTN